MWKHRVHCVAHSHHGEVRNLTHSLTKQESRQRRLAHIAHEHKVSLPRPVVTSDATSERDDGESEQRMSSEHALAIVRHWCAQAKAKGLYPLYLACEAGDVEGVQALLHCSFEMVFNESEEVRKYMRPSLEKLVNLAEEQKLMQTPLHAAARHTSSEIAALLIARKADVNALNQDRCSPLHIAAEHGRREIVSLLIAAKADIEIVNKSQRTPLYCAALKGHTEIVSLLIAQGVNIEAVDETTQCTSLHHATIYGRLETVAVLLAQKSDIEAKNKTGRTALHFATINGHAKLMSLLIAHRACIEARDENHFTPLHFAAENGHREIVSLLISQRANVEATNMSGRIPLEFARREDIKVLLRSANN